jgi:hypothetical protein
MVPSHQRVNREGTIPLWGEILGPGAIQPWQDALTSRAAIYLDTEETGGSPLTALDDLSYFSSNAPPDV